MRRPTTAGCATRASGIETERSANQLTVVIQTAKPASSSASRARRSTRCVTSSSASPQEGAGQIHEIKTPELDATLVAENVASQLEKRIVFRARSSRR